MFQQKGTLSFCVILTLASIHSVFAIDCKDLSNTDFCVTVGSYKGLDYSFVTYCSRFVEKITVNVDGGVMYSHCKYGTARDTPNPPSKPMLASDKGSQLIARIRAALGLGDKASAQSCKFYSGERLCIYIKHNWSGTNQWYCSDDSNVDYLSVRYNYGETFSCSQK